MGVHFQRKRKSSNSLGVAENAEANASAGRDDNRVLHRCDVGRVLDCLRFGRYARRHRRYLFNAYEGPKYRDAVHFVRAARVAVG